MTQHLLPFALLLLAVFSLRQLRRLLHERKLKRLLRAGDWGGVLAAYHPTLSRLPNPETLGPLMVAGALAAHGMVDRARRALARAARGEAWEAALEHRRFVETLLETFDGDRGRAVECAESLEKLPLPKGSAQALRRVAALRSALTALARAFARCPRDNDAEMLEEASHSSPLVHWAMRYGAAVAYLERGDRGRARLLLVDAPRWPADSTFCAFQEELAGLAREPSAV
ncbi:MAG TPA: hypothetical protein VEQ59_12955 [Polyangiaceae bacterium]|nr:hypothetical protein [Polyangiaceae bacterium]